MPVAVLYHYCQWRQSPSMHNFLHWNHLTLHSCGHRITWKSSLNKFVIAAIGCRGGLYQTDTNRGLPGSFTSTNSISQLLFPGCCRTLQVYCSLTNSATPPPPSWDHGRDVLARSKRYNGVTRNRNSRIWYIGLEPGFCQADNVDRFWLD